MPPWRSWPCTCGSGPPRILRCTSDGSRAAAATWATRRRTSGLDGVRTSASTPPSGDGPTLPMIGEPKSTDDELVNISWQRLEHANVAAPR
eukprot:6573495-Pyramimonas_sp.AAC.1